MLNIKQYFFKKMDKPKINQRWSLHLQTKTKYIKKKWMTEYVRVFLCVVNFWM